MGKRLYLDTSVLLGASDRTLIAIAPSARVPQLAIVELLLRLRRPTGANQALRALDRASMLRLEITADPFDEIRHAFGGHYRDWPSSQKVVRRLVDSALGGRTWEQVRAEWMDSVGPGGIFLWPDPLVRLKDSKARGWMEAMTDLAAKERVVRERGKDVITHFFEERGLGIPTRRDLGTVREWAVSSLRASAWPRIWLLHKLAQVHNEAAVSAFPVELLDSTDSWGSFDRACAYYGYRGGLDLAFRLFTHHASACSGGSLPEKNDFFDLLISHSVPDSSEAFWVTMASEWLTAGGGRVISVPETA